MPTVIDTRKIEPEKDLNRTYTVLKMGNVIQVKEYDDSYKRKPMTEYEKMRLRKRREELILQREIEGREEENKRRSATRSMTEVRQLVLTNFTTDESKFFTITFEENITDVERANREFKKYIQKLRRRFGNEFKYLAVIEFQKRGAVHYHVLFDENFPLVPVTRRKAEELKGKGKLNEKYPVKENLEEIWGNGWVSIEKIGHVNDLGKYLIKYMIKDFGDERLRGKKNFFGSRNLIRPEKITDYKEAIETIEKYGLYKKKTSYATSYESEWCGTVVLREYRID